MINGHSNLREFGRYRLDIKKKVLWASGEPVSLPLKAVELLCVLVESRGGVVSKDEIWHHVWQDSFVEETNLTHTIYLLRKAFKDLGEKDLIKTVPRRGYRFTGEVREIPLGDVIIERHGLTRTSIEIEENSGPNGSDPAIAAGKSIRARFFAPALVSVLLFPLGGGAYFGYQSWGHASRPKIASIAVLPLIAINEDKDSTDHEGLGLADTLITRLGSLKDLTVRPTSSIASYEGQTVDSRDVGTKLGVDSVLEGTIYRNSDEVRVTMRLIDVGDGKIIWSGQFEKAVREELRLQDEIALKVAEALAINLDPQEKHLITKRYTDNRDAYEAYLRGRFFFDKRDPSIYPKAIEEYQKAIDLDPNYALAFAGLADTYSLQGNDANDADRDGFYDKAIDALQTALAIDEELSEAHTSLAWIKRIHEWDWSGSEREFKRAIELNPNYYNAHMWYSFLLITLGRKSESLAEIERARELAPLNPTVLDNYAAIRYFCQNNDQLLPVAEQIQSLGARDYSVTRLYSQIYLRLGQFQKVIDLINEFETRNNNRQYNTLRSNLAAAYALNGQKEKAEPIIRVLAGEAEHSGEAAYRLSLDYADMRRNDEAITCLQKALDTRDDRLMWIKVEPRFDHLRGDARFQDILKQMNLSDQ